MTYKFKNKGIYFIASIVLGGTFAYYAYNWEGHSESIQLLVFILELAAIYILKSYINKKDLEKKILELKESEERVEHLAKEFEKFKLAVDSASDHVIIADQNGNIIYANKASEHLTGFTVKEMLGKKPGELWGGQMEIPYYKKMWGTIKLDKKPFVGMVKNKKKDGELYDASLSISPILDKQGNPDFFVGLERDVTKEMAIDRAKSEFVSLASHQLRTPLSTVKWYTELLMNGKTGALNKKQKEYLHEIEVGNERMISLVNDLLRVSRLELGTFEVKPELSDLCKIVEELVGELKLGAKSKKLTISCSVEPLPQMLLDVQLTRFILQNIISNALKYTPEKGNIKVSVSKNELEALVTVSDNGCGIPLAQQEKIFQKFFRADNVREKETEGTGLGLYIAKSISDAVGGKIWFESAEDKGTKFFISFPLEGMKVKEGKKIS